MSHPSVFRPRYELRPVSEGVRIEPVYFLHAGTQFIFRSPVMGMTQTQKEVMKWATWQRLPPVMCITHGKTSKPDKEFLPTSDLHQHSYPYAMVIATVQCMGEERPRTATVYFCNNSVHEHNAHTINHSSSRRVRVFFA